MSDIDEYKKELVDEMYCDDHYGELCDGDCDSCRRLAESNLNELENMVRADERAKVLETIKEIIATKTNPMYWIEQMISNKCYVFNDVLTQITKEQK